jgi:hypothetical protein
MKKEYDFRSGRRGAVLSIPKAKTRITIRIDDDVLDWFRRQVHRAGGGSYQTSINLALREHISRLSQPLEETLKHVLREELSQYDIPRLGSASALADTLGKLLGAQVQTFLSPRRIDRELILAFFMVFTRTEYALKRQHGFVRERRDSSIDILWEEFAGSIASRVWRTDDQVVREALDYLSSNPPKKQILRGGALAWESSSPAKPGDAVFLLRSIKTVRNNLFHGGKEIQLMAERDRTLVESSLVALAHCVTLNRDVHDAFLEMPPEDVAA